MRIQKDGNAASAFLTAEPEKKKEDPTKAISLNGLAPPQLKRKVPCCAACIAGGQSKASAIRCYELGRNVEVAEVEVDE